jgi:hypothetical protein
MECAKYTAPARRMSKMNTRAARIVVSRCSHFFIPPSALTLDLQVIFGAVTGPVPKPLCFRSAVGKTRIGSLRFLKLAAVGSWR